MKLGTLSLGPPHSAGPSREEIALEQARRAGWPELNHDDLTFHRHFVEHAPSGDFYQLHRGELADGLYTSAAAYYMTDRGGIVFLERPPGGMPQTCAELEQLRAAREQRRNAPRPRRQVTPR